eukprot:Gb_16050 [translate_table: standard]
MNVMYLKVYAWELPGVAGNACNGLTPTIALQLATVVYGANLFSVLLEDLEAAWLLECLRTLILAWHYNYLQLVYGRWSIIIIVRVIGFVTGGETALFLSVKIIQSCFEVDMAGPLGFKAVKCLKEKNNGSLWWRDAEMLLFESEVFEGILRFDGRKLEEVSRHHQLQPTEVAWTNRRHPCSAETLMNSNR